MMGQLAGSVTTGDHLGSELLIDNMNGSPLDIQLVVADGSGDEQVLQTVTLGNGLNNVTLYGEATMSGTLYLRVTEDPGVGEMNVNNKLVLFGIKYYAVEDISETYTAEICPQDEDFDEDYRFGFNGQQKTNEIAGIGNHNTATFWEYDTRLGRRWNLDPKPQIRLSDYAVFANNPLSNTDLLGDVVEHATFKDKLFTTAGRILNRDFRKNYRQLKRSNETYRFQGSKDFQVKEKQVS